MTRPATGRKSPPATALVLVVAWDTDASRVVAAVGLRVKFGRVEPGVAFPAPTGSAAVRGGHEQGGLVVVENGALGHGPADLGIYKGLDRLKVKLLIGFILAVPGHGHAHGLGSLAGGEHSEPLFDWKFGGDTAEPRPRSNSQPQPSEVGGERDGKDGIGGLAPCLPSP